MESKSLPILDSTDCLIGTVVCQVTSSGAKKIFFRAMDGHMIPMPNINSLTQYLKNHLVPQEQIDEALHFIRAQLLGIG